MCTEGCLKKTLGILAFVVVFIGVAIIVIGSILLSNISSSQIFQEGDNSAFWAFGSIILGMGIVIFLLGVAGVYGGFKKKRCCICLYNISLFPTTLIFLTLAIVGVAISDTLLGDIQQEINYNAKNGCNDFFQSTKGQCKCGEYSDFIFWISEINQYINQTVLQEYGQNPNVTVDISSNPNLKYYLVNNQFVPLKNDSIYDGEPGKNTTTVYTSATNWLNSLKTNASIPAYNFLMEYLESSFSCSGMCSPVPFYLFTNTANTRDSSQTSQNMISNGPCYQSVYNFFDSYAVAIYGTLFGVGSFFGIQILLSLWLCCKRDKKDASFYQRMDYID